VQEFTGKVAVVTGAGSGMGRAFAQRLAEEGMKVALADIQVDALDQAVKELTADGHEVIGVPTDVSKEEAIQHLADETIAAFGKVHVVCNNAGVEGYLDGPIWEATHKDWEWTVGVNYWSVVYGIRTFVPLILSHGEEGHVVNTASMTAVVRAGNMYGIFKHATLATSETLWGDLQRIDAPIGVTAVCPGIIATRLFQGSRNRPQELQNETPTSGAQRGKEMREAMHARLSEGMAPSEVARQVVEKGIRGNQLYLLTDHDWDPAVGSRAINILTGTNPTMPTL
jgi:NAD(P)-dependent dehydrogenase (short-subunit alcohol dehydrogenase family)